jgi:hypothetical protein
VDLALPLLRDGDQAEDDVPREENRLERIVGAGHNESIDPDAILAALADRPRSGTALTQGQNVEQPGVLVARSQGAHLWLAAQSLGPRMPSELLTTHSLTQTPHRLRNVAGQPCSAIVLYGGGKYSSGTQR